MRAKSTVGQIQFDFGDLTTTMPKVLPNSGKLLESFLPQSRDISSTLMLQVQDLLSHDNQRAALLYSMGLTELDATTRFLPEGNQINVYLEESEWLSFIKKTHLSCFDPVNLALPLDSNDILFPVSFLNFGKGNLNSASLEWLLKVQALRSSEQNILEINPNRKELYFRLAYNEESKELTFNAPSEPADLIISERLSDINFNRLKSNPNRIARFGPLTVSDIRHNYHGQMRFSLSDGHQKINSNFVSIDSDHHQIELGDVVWVDGIIVYSHSGDTLDLRIKKITRFLDEPVALCYTVSDVDLQKKPAAPVWERVHVRSADELIKFISLIKDEEIIMLDIESHRDKRNPKLHTITLIQVGIPDHKRCYLLEGEAINQWVEIKNWLEDEKQKKVIHYSKFEKKRFLEHDIELGAVIDTWELVQKYFPHIQNRQLGNCLWWLCEIQADKSLQNSDWIPPFSSKQYDYAQLDVELLSILYTRISNLIEASDIELNRPIDQLMKSLHDLDVDIAQHIEREQPCLIAIQNELDYVSKEAVNTLGKGAPAYDGSYGSLSLGYHRSLLDPKKVKTILRQRRVLDSDLEDAIDDKLRLSFTEVEERLKQNAFGIADTLIEKISSSQHATDLEPIYVVNTSSAQALEHGESTERYSVGADLVSLAHSLNDLHTRMLEVIHRKDNLLLSYLVKRSLLWNAITQHLANGDAYNGPFGEAYVVNQQVAVSFTALRSLIENEPSDIQLKLKTCFSSSRPWLTKESFASVLRDKNITIESEEMRKLNLIASIFSKNRGAPYLRPGSAK